MKLKLDKRIPNHNCIFTCFDTESAEQYIGKQGYFTSCYSNFANINNLPKGRLTGIDESMVSEKYHANVGNANVRKEYYSFFLPEDYLKPEEKVFRPCTLDEFGLHIGDLIRFRRKDDHNFEICTMYMGYRKKNGGVNVLLGNNYYTLEELFNDYEWYDSDSHTWEMFGVEE